MHLWYDKIFFRDQGDLCMEAMSVHVCEDAMDFSRSFTHLRHCPSYAKVRSTTHLRVRTTNPIAPLGRLTISTIGRSNSRTAFTTLSPEQALSAKIRVNVGKLSQACSITTGAASPTRREKGIWPWTVRSSMP